MTTIVGAAMLGVTGWCAARLLLPGLRAPGHGRALEAWHLLMGAAMAAMLLASVPGPAAVGATVFGCAALWALRRAHRGPARAAHLRLAAGCAAMAVMLVPGSPASATSTPMAGSMHGSGGHPATGLPGPVLAVVVLALGAVLAAAALRLVRRTTPGAERVDAGCEALMSLAMAAMLLSVL